VLEAETEEKEEERARRVATEARVYADDNLIVVFRG